MRKITLLLLVFVLSPVSFGANWYVDPSKANDSGDGTTPATAEKTVAAAITDASDGDTIYLIAGTYDDSTQGESWYLNLAKTITFENYTTPVTLIFHRSTSVAILSSGMGDTITFNGQIFDGDGVTNWLIYTYSGCTNNFVFNDCSIVANSFDCSPLFYFADSGNVDINNFTASIEGLVLKVGGTGVTSNGNITVRNSNFLSNTGNTSYMISISPDVNNDTVGLVTIRNTSVGCTSSSGRILGISGYCDVIPGVVLEDSNFASGSLVGFIGREWGDANNWDSSAPYKTYNKGDIVEWKAEYYLCHTAHTDPGGGSTEPGCGADWKKYWEIFRGPPTRISGCRFHQLEEDQHSLLCGWLKFLSVDNCIAYGGNYQFVLKGGCGYTVENCCASGANCYSFYSTDSPVFRNNSAYCTGGSAALIIGNMNDGYDCSYDGICENNIFVQTADLPYLWHDDDMTADANWIFNNNCYYKSGSGAWFYYLSAERDTLSDLQAAFAANSIISPNNDANSIAADPEFIDPAKGDFRLKPSSPCLNTGKPTGGGKTTIGAWQPASCESVPSGDLNNDFIVDFYDFAKMTENWLIDCILDPNDSACVLE